MPPGSIVSGVVVDGRPRRFAGGPQAAGGAGPDGAAGFVVAILSGVATAAAFEPVAMPLLAPLGVAGLVVATRTAGYRRAAITGWAYGVAFMLALLFWLAGSVGVGAWLVLGLLQACWFALLGCIWVGLRVLPLWWLWAATAWVALEQLRSALPLGGLPWGRLGFASIDSPWAAGLPVLGVTGTSWVIALVGATAGTCLAASGTTVGRRVAMVVSAVAVSLAPGVAAAGLDPVTVGTVRIGIVQGGVPGSGTRLVEHHREVTLNHLEATEDLAAAVAASGGPDPDLVLWPENATAVDPFRDEIAGRTLRQAAAVTGVPVLAGSIVDLGTSKASNQGIVWNPEGPGDTYTKQHLVPFGEYVPWRSVVTRFSDRLRAIPRDMVPGRTPVPLRIAGIPVADALCFDIAYDDVIAPQVEAGAQVVTVQTSNAMFLGTSQLDQQFAITRVRALEAGRSVAVASVNGVSGAIAPDGDVVTVLPVMATDSRLVELPLRDGVTPALRLGGLTAGAPLVIAAVSLIAAASRRLARRRLLGRSRR